MRASFARLKTISGNCRNKSESSGTTGPQISGLFQMLEENDLRIGPPGKGRACWIAYGYVLASQQSDIIALHDCDIVNYDRDLLARLVYPIANPTIDFEFCKGYYARVTDRMHGRVTRLLMTPLLRSLISVLGSIPVLVFMDSFRYPLAGEFAMKVDLARANRIPPDWGLEVGVLAKSFGTAPSSESARSICVTVMSTSTRSFPRMIQRKAFSR